MPNGDEQRYEAADRAMVKGLASARIRLLTAAWLGAGLMASHSQATAQQDAGGLQRAQEAAVALRGGNLEQALALYGDALSDRTLPNDRRSIILNDRGVVLMRQQQYRAAIEDFNRAAVLYPEFAPIYNNRGNLLLQIGQSAESIKDFDRAILLAPAYGLAWSNRGAAQLKLGQLDKAVLDYTRAIEISGQNASAFNGRGRAHLAANRPYSAQRDFARAVQINAGFSAAYRNRAEAKVSIDSPDEAVEDLSRALAFDPHHVESYLRRGTAYLASGNAASAIKDFNKAIELAPRAVIGYTNRGFAHAKAEAFDEALNDFAKAIELNPRDGRAYALRAWVYKLTQQPDLGLKDIERALRSDPVTADAYWAQGEIEEALGRNDTAAAAITKALAIDPLHRDARAALQRLGVESGFEGRELTEAGFEKWRVYARGGAYVAVNETMPSLKVALEVYGAAQPKILAWDRRKAPFAGIGVLRYAAGSITSDTGVEDVENAAIIDMQGPAVISMQVARLGARASKWTWDQGRVSIAGVDGTAEELTLRASKAKDQKDRDGGTQPGAAEVFVEKKRETLRSSPAQQTAARPPPRQKPKTLFELIFGN